MARYDDIVEQNKKYLTQAQIQALADASTQYNAQNAGNRAGALATAREQYDTGYRGLQNMGLAGAGQPMSGEVPRLERQIRTPFEDYNQRLQDVEHMRLSALGSGMAQQTQAEMAAEAERQRQAAEQQRLAAEQRQREAEYQRAVAAAQALATNVKNSFIPSWLQKTTDAVKSVAAKAAAKAQNDGIKRTEQLKQQAQQQAVAANDKYQQDGMKRTARPQDIAAAAAFNVAHYTSTPVVESANAAQEKGIKLTEKLKGEVDTTSANKYFVGPNKTTFTQAEADADLKSAQQEYDNLRWKQHYGGKVSKEEMASAQNAVAMAKLKAEKPETYSALAIYNDPAYKGSKQYDNAVGIIAEEEAKALVKQTYGRDIDTSMTYDQFEKTGKDIRQLKDLLKRYDYAEKTLKLAKDQKMSEATIAEDQALVDSVVADLEKMGYSVDKARDTAENYTSDRDARAEIEYYKNALSAVMKNEGKTPTKPVNEKETDPTYRAVNGLPDIGDNSQVLVPGRLPTPTWQGIKKDFTSVAHMSESEKNAYNAIYEREGIKAANAYAEAIRPLTNIQRAKDDADYAKELANDQVATTILANLGSVPIRAAGSIPAVLEKYIVGGLNTLSDMYTGGTGVPKYIDTNSSAHTMANFASSIRSETSKRIIESNKDDPVLGEWANRAYQIGMSMADSAFNMAFGIAGAPWMTGLLAGSDAANEAYKDARARGGTQQQAMAVATACGIAENLFETVSLEYFTNQWIEKGAAWTRPFIVKWGLGAGVEGSEEVFTSVSNLLSDIYIMKDKSEWQEIVDKHGPEGLKDAILEEMGNLGADFLGGAISGGVFGLFGGAFNGVLSYAETTQIGKQAESLGLVQKYEDMAAVLGGKAEKTAAKVESKPTAHKVGKMVNQVNNQLSQAFTGNERTDIPMALLFSGKQLSFTEANDVYQALGSETLEKMGYAADSARSFMNSFNQRMTDTGIYARTQERLKESQATLASVQAEEHLTMTDQLAGTEYNEKNVAQNKAMREALEKRVWKNPNVGIAVTDDGEEIPALPGNMTRVGWAEMNRKNFKAQSTVTKGRTTYELSSMAMREGMTNEEAYAAMRENMQEGAKKSADFYEKLSDSLGLDIVVHDVMRGSNGFLKDGKLHVVLSSRQNATRIASHELTHYMKAHSPEKFAKLMGNLVREVGQREFDRQVAAKAAFYGFDTNSRSGLANAREEVCAELCERMLSNEDMLARFAQRETDTARAMKSHLQQTVEAIRNALTGDENRDFGNSNSSMIKAAETMDSWIDGLTDAIANAEAQKKTMMGQVAITAGVTETDHNRLVDALSDTKTEEEFDDVFTEFSVDIIEYDLAGYMQDLKTVMDADEIEELYSTMTEAISEVKAHRSLLDFGEEYGSEAEILQAKKDRKYSPYKKNSDPHYKVALDFSTLCRKRVLLQAIQERLQAKLQRALSQEEIVAIRLELQKLQKENYSVEVACALCYVEAARLKTGNNINAFIYNTEAEMRNYFAKKSATTKAMVTEYQAQWKQQHGYAETATKDQMSGADVEAFNEASRQYREQIGGSSAEEQRIIAKAVELAKTHPEVFLAQTQLAYLHEQDPSKYLSPAQLRDLMTDYPDIFAALAQKITSAARAKAQETDTFYSRGDIARVSAAVIAAANLESGFRHQSWSDFVPKHLLDTMAAIIEMSTVKTKDKITNEDVIGAKMHAYTKVPAMVEFLGNTGMMLNMSLIPEGNGIDPVTGELIWDKVEGMPWQTMMDLRNRFADTAGNIAIGVSDEQIRLLLDSPDIDYVIPYHASGMNKDMRSYLDIKDWAEYTRSQNEKGDKKLFPALREWFDEKAAAKAEDGYAFMQQASEKYLQLCADRKLKPKFAQYLKKNSDGSYSLRDDYKNYWKLLIDRKMVNQKTGKVIIQQAVKPNFNKDTVMQILRNPVNEVLSKDAEKAADLVTEKFSGWQKNRNNASAAAIAETKQLLKDLKQKGPIMHSIDDEYMDLAERYAAGTATKAQKERLQQMVSEASSRYIEGFILPDDTDEEGFKFHRGPAPTKTFKRYAVLNVTEDGFKAAYAGNRNATPVGPWLDAQNLQSYLSDITKFKDGSYATYIKGDTGFLASTKFSPELLAAYGLKPSQHMLLERGGKHSSDVPNFSQMNISRDENGNKVKNFKRDGSLPHNKLIFEIEYGTSDDGNLTDYVREHGRIDATGRNQGIPKIGPNQFYDFKTNPNAVGNWGLGGTFRIRRLVTMDEVVRVTNEYKQNAIAEAKRLYDAGQISKADMNARIQGAESIQVQKWEGGLHPEDFGLTVESVDQMFQNGKKMKLGDLVTYDDNGKIIPLSQRFNPDVEDARYSIDPESMELPSLMINDREKDFTGEIMRGEKTIETRTYSIPKALVGKWVPIIRTGKGAKNNQVVGYVKFSGDKKYSSASEFRADEEKHLVKAGSGYDINGTKYGWVIEDVKPLDNPITIGTQGFAQGEYRYRDLAGIIDDPNTMHSIDEETSEPAQYSAEAIEQLEGVSEFLDQITKGDQQLREKLISALMPVIEQKVAAAEKQANKPVRTAQNGMKPAGKQPRVRDVSVPQYAKTGNPVSDFVRSFLESDKATDEMVADLMDKIANGEWGSYTRLTNVEAMNAARDFIANRTLSKAQEEFHDMVKSGRYNVQTRAIGLQLLAEAAQRGDAEQVLNIATDLRELATDAGQSVQIFSVLKELGGVGSAWYMQKKIDSLNAKYQDKISAGKMNEITIDADLMQDLIEAKTTAEIEAAEDEIAKAIAKQLPLTWESRISNWRYLAMLANPTTHFRNLTGNFFMESMNKTKDAVAAGIERLAVRDISKRAHAVLTLNDKKTWGDYAERNYNDQEKVLRGNGKFGFETQLRQYMRAFDTKWLNKIAQFNFNALENEDMWFIKPAYKNALMQYMKAQGYTLQDGVAGKMVKGEFKAMTKEQLNAAQEWAAQQAWKATFHDASALATMLNNASKKLGPVGNVLIEGVMPFKKTPINIAKRGLEYSPAGIVMGAVQLAKDVKTGKVTTAAAIDNIASGITGSTLMAVGAILAKMGLLRSGGEDKKKHETYMSDTGDQTYALKIGGVSIGLSALAPATIPLFMGAALYDALDKHGEGLDLSALTETAANTLNPFMEMSFMSSLNSALKSYSNDGIGGALGNTLLTAAESYGSQFLPTVVAKAGQVFDPINRTTKSSAASPVGSGLDYYARSLAKKVPGLEATLQPDVDVWGRTTNTMDSFGKWALDFANKFIFPANVKVASKTAIDDELIRVVESTGNADILPSDGPKYFIVKGEKYPMTAAQYTEYSIDRGQASYVALKETMMSDAYKSSTDEARADMLKNALSAAQKQVNDVWKEKLGAVEPVTAEPVKEQTEVKATQGDYSDPALYKVAASYPKAYDKAAKAKAKGISPDTFLDLYEKKDTYSGEDLTKYTRQEIMKSNLSVKQKEFMDDLIVSDKGTNPDYSSQGWFDVSMLGKSKYDEAKMGAQVGLKPETYYKVYTKWKTLDAKDANGKTVNGLKKKRAKEYLDSLTLSGPEYSFIWTVMFGY